MIENNIKTIKNNSIQGLNIILNTENGPNSIWLYPKQTILVKKSEISNQIINLHDRRMIKISN